MQFIIRKKKKSVRSFRHPWRWLAVGGGVGAVIGLCTFLFFSKTFTLDRIDVQAAGSLDPSAVRSVLFTIMEERRAIFFSQKNFFTFDTASAERELRDNFSLESLSIAKHLPNRIVVALSGSPFRALWVSGESVYELTPQGAVRSAVDPAVVSGFPAALLTSSSTHSVLPPKKKERASPTPIIVDEKRTPVAAGATVVDEGVLSFILTLSAGLSDARIPVQYFATSRDSFDVRVITKDGWEAYLTHRDSPERQLSSLVTILHEKIKKKKKNLLYVDVRFEQRLYYKFK
ncbi:MAG: hypothetical protein AAB416_02895 [Patescibacteria group bacterium]